MSAIRLVAVHTTVGSSKSAQAIARAIVERRLAACAQITPIESFYVWDGAVVHEAEFRLMLKTRAALYPAIEAAIRELHPYQLPAIHATAVECVSGDYAAWVEANTDAPV